MKKMLILALAVFVGQAKCFETTSFSAAPVFAGSLGVGLAGIGIYYRQHQQGKQKYQEDYKKYCKDIERHNTTKDNTLNAIQKKKQAGAMALKKSTEKTFLDLCKECDMTKPIDAHLKPDGRGHCDLQFAFKKNNSGTHSYADHRLGIAIAKDDIYEEESDFQKEIFKELVSNLSETSKQELEKQEPGWQKKFQRCTLFQEGFERKGNSYLIENEAFPTLPYQPSIGLMPKVMFSGWLAITTGIAAYWWKHKAK